MPESRRLASYREGLCGFGRSRGQQVSAQGQAGSTPAISEKAKVTNADTLGRTRRKKRRRNSVAAGRDGTFAVLKMPSNPHLRPELPFKPHSSPRSPQTPADSS